jgi:hypothetical protein
MLAGSPFVVLSDAVVWTDETALAAIVALASLPVRAARVLVPAVPAQRGDADSASPPAQAWF